MPITRAAYRELKKTHNRTQRNKSLRSELKTRVKKLRSLVAENKMQEAEACFKTVEKRLHQAAAKNVIHKNTASRKISRLQTLLKKS